MKNMVLVSKKIKNFNRVRCPKNTDTSRKNGLFW